MKRLCYRLTALCLSLVMLMALQPVNAADVGASIAITAPWEGAYTIHQSDQIDPEAAVDLQTGEPVLISGLTADTYTLRSAEAVWDIPSALQWRILEIPVPGLCDRLTVVVQGTENGASRTAAVTYSLNGTYFTPGETLSIAIPDFDNAVTTHRFTTVNPTDHSTHYHMDDAAPLPAVAVILPFATARDIWRLSQNNPAHSPWATQELQQSMRQNLCPSWLNRNWQLPISRAEFCRLAVHVLVEMTGKSASLLLSERNITYRTVFTDTEDETVNICALLGIVQGTDAEKRLFSPNNNLTRAQTAVILRNLSVNMLNAPTISPPHNFADITETWSDAGLSHVQHTGLMQGTGISFSGVPMFSPVAHYTREQSMAVFLRLYQSYS